MRDFVVGAGFHVGSQAVLPAGTSDERAARWVARSYFDLVVIPFHLHRGDEGLPLDGIGVLLLLPYADLLNRMTFFMPVRSFSYNASFHRRFETLRERRPDILPLLITVHQDDMKRGTLVTRLRRASEAKRSASGVRSYSIPPAEEMVFSDSRSLTPPAMRLSLPPSARVRSGIEHARESFRKATEIGAQAQKDFEEERKTRRRRR